MTTSPSARIGIIGTGAVFPAYARGLAALPGLTVVRVADLDEERSRTAAAEWGIPAWGSAADLLADPGVDVVVNITTPAAHAALTDAALEAGKHVYVEKPLAVTTRDARRNIATAERTGRVLGGAPDTFLGSAAQTARAAVDAGLIGRPFAATSFVRSSRAQTWHPDPTFLFKPGGGPVLDWGPYHIAALVNLLGPITRVVGATANAELEIPVTAPDRRVERIDVEVATHATSILQFTSGVLATAVYSFDIWDTDLPHIEVYGTEGTLQIPDPNHFDAPVRLKRRTADEWTQLPPVLPLSRPDTGDAGIYRGLGVQDLVGHLAGDAHRASAGLALHVLDVLERLQDATLADGVADIMSSTQRPAPVRGVVPLAG
ncbi:Gfo/Idh/MocA family protein [Marinitenerispora sediminis]|uniref:Gfo/Idh/MocA family oxidoreductase n=1 Tax=Marinitenerispora sediminis TaxID=1931232 RepID=A0A368SZ97_9ACTN|nr:Gfo/Idh/MocA family oxidoreductase [Marinitenerispora sediminis]RCV47965.1 gfo/Idh/MocA family oxidoreductase [Marinitenerispora sediminis]RCV49056.1 gfo/Idh/MocA family oxidoreductase [Marinitenerispora sediminis]RCV50968.1 gfo/Idh/MocA family oxidoreductase [Marinitenerispora sediminis]